MRSESTFKKRRRLVAVIAVLAVTFGVIAVANRSAIRDSIEQLIGNDFSGSGHGSVQIVIAPGDTGEIVALKLEEAGVVKNFRATYKLILELDPTFHPGTYKLALEQSSRNAIDALSSGSATVVEKIVVKEGMRLNAIIKLISDKTGLDKSELTRLADDESLWHLPSGAPSLEGYLFPATYSFSPDITAKQALMSMRVRMDEEIAKFQIPEKDIHRVLTIAGLVQKEARIEADFYKVSRVFQNRLAKGMKLQSDATVSYGVNGTTVSTSAADRANDNPYNTYLHVGLPAGPISSPGSVAIDAALNPAKGDWIYFCAVNLATGETVFSSTYAQHEVAVAQWRQWMKENPGYE